MGSCKDWPSGDAESNGLWKVNGCMVIMVNGCFLCFVLYDQQFHILSQLSIFAFTHKRYF